jgi:hypothetical protein
MTSLKCWNSGVASSGTAFIILPKRACACRAPASSCSSGAHLSSRFRLTDQIIIRQPASDNLGHYDCKPLGVRQFPIVEPKALFVSVGLQVKRLDAHIRALKLAFQQAPEVLQSVRVNIPAHVGFSVVDKSCGNPSTGRPR